MGEGWDGGENFVTPRELARLQQRLEALCAASIRALAGERNLHFRGARLHRGRQRLPLFAPHLHPKLGRDDFGSFRGAADGIALRLALSDSRLHAALKPAEPAARLVFEMLEQFRVEALADAQHQGVQHNLRHRFESWSREFFVSGGAETASGLLLYTVAQICRSRVTGEPVLEASEDTLESTRHALAPLIGHALAGLKRERANQAVYARHALSIAEVVQQMLRNAAADVSGGRPDGEANHEHEHDRDERLAFSLLMEDPDTEPADGSTSAVSSRGLVPGNTRNEYRIFTTAYDREQRASTLVRPAQLAEFRKQLDQHLASTHLNLPRLARELKALFAEPRRDGVDAGLEEGLIDGRRLAQLVASPTERRLFRAEREQPEADVAVSFLIDCSGSMRQYAAHVAQLVEAFTCALEMAGATSEVLGFTTRAWNGGRALREWQRAGRPAAPGRLNEVHHLVFKDAATPWRRARRDIAALLKADLFREGIDGEAVDWAARRLLAQEAKRRLLVVVSDGGPMDGATTLANSEKGDKHLLDQHLRDVVQRVEDGGAVEVFGLGVGPDLSAFYGHCQAIDLDGGVNNALLREVLDLLATRRQR